MATEATNAAPNASAGGGHEKRDIRVRPLVLAGTIFVAAWALAFILAWLLFTYFIRREARLSPPPNFLEQMYGRQVPPEPRLQTNPLLELQQMRADEDTALHSYGWVERQAGTVHIPIDRAMALLAQRGLPARSEAAPAAPVAPEAGRPEPEPPSAQPPPAGGGQ